MTTLHTLYQKHHAQMIAVRERFPDEELYGPLLCAPTAYFDQPRRLLVIGQETNGWACNPCDLDGQLAAYRDFNVGENWRMSPFWQLTRKIEALLGIAPCACAWTNLSRYDQDHRPPKGAVLTEITTLDFLVREEITALRPDVCLFFTNRKHDSRLRAVYEGLSFEDVPVLPPGHFSRLIHPDLPTLTIRTPHPKSIRLRKLEPALLEAMRQLHSFSAQT